MLLTVPTNQGLGQDDMGGDLINAGGTEGYYPPTDYGSQLPPGVTTTTPGGIYNPGGASYPSSPSINTTYGTSVPSTGNIWTAITAAIAGTSKGVAQATLSPGQIITTNAQGVTTMAQTYPGQSMNLSSLLGTGLTGSSMLPILLIGGAVVVVMMMAKR